MIGSRSHVALTGLRRKAREQHLRRCVPTKRRRRTYDSAPSGARLPPKPAPHISRSTTIATKPTAAKPEGKKRAPNAAFAKPMTISPALAAVVGADPIPRTEVTKRLWDYIKAHKLQDAQKRTLINADDK